MSDQQFKPPLAVHFIWHSKDSEKIQNILDLVRVSFARDVDRPFSRGLNVPLFFYCAGADDCLNMDKPKQYAEKDVVFVFTSVNTMGNLDWQSYVNQLSSFGGFQLVPVAVDNFGLRHAEGGGLNSVNFLRLYDWDENHREQIALLRMAHEIYRHGLVVKKPDEVGKCSSINIFLSHAKMDGVGNLHADEIRRYIDNTNMNRFFDAYEISPGFKFDDEIINHIKKSTLLLIGSDSYSSRYWCQREVLCAKQFKRPILSVDCLKEFEDRVFPAGANIPCVHVSADTPIIETDILRILIATILETIRHIHAEKSLKYYQKCQWIDVSCEVLSRPPEIRQIIEFSKSGVNKVCYPEPSLYSEESDWLSYFDIEAFTPLWNSEEDKSLNNIRIGISISESDWGAYTNFHLHSNHLKRLSQDLARHLLARSGVVLYGGDLREDGFTEFILEEAIALKSRLNTDDIHVENHLAWPLYVPESDRLAWTAKYSGIMKIVQSDIPTDLSIDKTQYLKPSGVHNSYIWSRCLTEMREKSISGSNARICAGGKLLDYKGKMPGVLEEILISLEQEKPIFLLGAFGGVVKEVCQTIMDKSITEPLTEMWQEKKNAEYRKLQEEALKKNRNADYLHIKTVLEGGNLDELAKKAGLSISDYKKLMESPFIDECVHLILKGLKQITTNVVK